MVLAHNLGFPRIGRNRALKHIVEAFWAGKKTITDLHEEGKQLRTTNWAMQAQVGLNILPVGDFSWYDHILDLSLLLSAIPPRFGTIPDLNTCFRVARGDDSVPACALKKWFDTNYHYIVPELAENQEFALSNSWLFDEVAEAQSLGYNVKPVLVGPITYLWLSKGDNKLSLLPSLIQVYREIFNRFAKQNIKWVQIDEPILVLDLPVEWQRAFPITYEQLSGPSILLTTYFGSLQENTEIACNLPVGGIHIDAIRAPEQIPQILKALPKDKILSVGIVDGRNIWRTDLVSALACLQPIHEQIGDQLWIGGSCSLLHCPVDLTDETKLDPELKAWLAFAVQKVEEITLLAKALNEGPASIAQQLAESQRAVESRKLSKRIHRSTGKTQITDSMTHRNPYSDRHKVQQKKLPLPLFPTTTIGSFPQTNEIRSIRHEFKLGKMSKEAYENKILKQIEYTIHKQEQLGLDVLVHGEAERSDMVEYFAEQLEGFAFTTNGWVQSYGTRYVKPPILYGDVHRPHPMTVSWIVHAQSLTKKPVKGMLTGPLTLLCWSFARDDQPRTETAKQIALALRDEVLDLERAGVQIIQIDEPAFREGLPLRRSLWNDYLTQAVLCFRLTSCGVQDTTQIHTHMCYSEFNDIIQSIAALDADVISIEASRSDMQLLKAFESFHYPNSIGPGVYDVHSQRVASSEEIVHRLEQALQFIPKEQLWVNPDCGLKTRSWPETEAALANMVAAAKIMRHKHGKNIA